MEVIPSIYTVNVGFVSTRLLSADWEGLPDQRWEHDSAAIDWIHNYDNEKPVEPFTAKLTLV